MVQNQNQQRSKGLCCLVLMQIGMLKTKWFSHLLHSIEKSISRTPCIIWDFTRSIDLCGQVLSFKPRCCYGIWASARNLWVEERWQKPGWLLFHAMVMGNLRWYHIHVLHWRETKTDRLAAHVQFVKGCSKYEVLDLVCYMDRLFPP